MNRFMKCTAGLLTAALVAGLTGCGGDTSWTHRSATAEITSGMYVGLSIDAMQSAYSVEGVDTSTSVFDQQLEGYDGLTWITNKTDELARQYLAVEEKFAELGLSFTAEEEAANQSYVSAYWNYVSSLYEDQGCGEASFGNLVRNTEKQQKIFNFIYGEGGEREVPESELRSQYESDYVKATYFAVPLIDDDRNALEDKALEVRKQEAEDLLKKIQDGADFEQVKAEYQAGDAEGAKPEGSDTAEYILKDSGYPEKLTDALFDARNGDVGLVEDTSYIYIWQKQALDDEGFDNVRSSILSRLKGEEFSDLLAQWTEEVDVTRNDAAIKKHSPKNLE